MKSAFVLAFVSAFALAASVGFVDWSKVEPLHINPPNVPVSPPVQGRIVGGEEAEPHSFPYQVGLLLEVGGKTAFCGGSLISNEYVLTAAHCCQPAQSAVVVLGAHNIKDEGESSQIRIEVSKENMIVHEQWSQTTLRNDIALIKLPKPVEFNEHIQPVGLPSRSQAKDLFVGAATIASGWGKDSDKATAVSPVLRFVKSKIIAKLACTIRYFGVIQDTHICMDGAGGRSTCNGDSGGPLVVSEANGSKTHIGLTSFGIAFGCEKGWPAVFTRTTSYLDWISEKTGIEIRN